jgi:hypothetical protein
VATPVTTAQGTPVSTDTATLPQAGPMAGTVTPVSYRAESTPAAVASPTPKVKEPAPTPSPTAKPAATTAPTASASKDSGVVDPGGLIEVKATKSGLTRIGADKCKLCHKVQFTSWAKTAHATRTPPLDCESCHGAGSAYKSMAIMKDSAKAHAAGLVTPDKAFCMTCHKSGWKDDLLKQAHAHKAGA